MNPVIELAMSEVEKLEGQTIDLHEQLGRINRTLEAWKVIISEANAHGPFSATVAIAPLQSGETAEDKVEATQAYGDKTNALRRYVILGGRVTRSQIVQKSKEIGGHPNFPYRFIARMLDAGELREENDRFMATDKMVEKISAVAA